MEKTFAVVAEDLAKHYPSGDESVVALDGVTCRFVAGETAALMGPSGCGKTSLLNLIAGIDRPTGGTLSVDGRDVGALAERELERYRLTRVGYIFQFFNLIPSLSALENLELPMLMAGTPPRARRDRARALLANVGLDAKMDKRPGELSGGEQQRVAICVALVNDPPLVLADEPTGNLDSANGARVTDLLVALAAEGKTVIVSTHDPDVAARFACVHHMLDGRIRHTSRPKETTP
ncbi:MAG: ABC transporter ATP-binding protein [Usitatibacter sp.]